MKKVYSFLMLMLAFCGFSTAQAGVVIDNVGEPLTDVSGIAEGDYLAFQETQSDKFLFNNKYNTSPSTYEWRLMFDKGDLPSALGQTSSEQYAWKVVGLSNKGNTITCQLQCHAGSYIPVLDNDNGGGFNFCATEGETFTFTKASSDDTWIISGASGLNFTAGNTSSKWFALIGTEEGSEFRIYKPAIQEGEATVTVTFECYDDRDGSAVSQYSSVQEVSIGGTVTVPAINWGYTFISCVGEDDKTYKQGEQIVVTGEATYTITVLSWPTITFAYYDEAGMPICEEGSTEPAKFTQQWQPGNTFTHVGGVYGYYVPAETLAEYTSMVITDDMDGKTFNITCKKSPYVTIRYVNESDQDIVNPFKGYITPGESIPVETIPWYTLNKSDSIYVYNYETQEGYTVGTEDTNIVLHYTRDALPFEATTVAGGVPANDTKWYTICFRGNKYMNSDLKLVSIEKPADITDELQWAFVGSLEDGYLIYNKATGSKTLGVEKAEEGAAPAMLEYGSTFLLKKNHNGQLTLSLIIINQYMMSIDACLNDYEGKDEVKLFTGNMYGGTFDEGSHIVFTEASELISGIEETVTDVQKTDNCVYDLQGRRVMKPANGLYIIAGKKVLIK